MKCQQVLNRTLGPVRTRWRQQSRFVMMSSWMGAAPIIMMLSRYQSSSSSVNSYIGIHATHSWWQIKIKSLSSSANGPLLASYGLQDFSQLVVLIVLLRWRNVFIHITHSKFWSTMNIRLIWGSKELNLRKFCLYQIWMIIFLPKRSLKCEMSTGFEHSINNYVLFRLTVITFMKIKKEYRWHWPMLRFAIIQAIRQTFYHSSI